MDSLQHAAIAYQNVCRHIYKYTFNNGAIIQVKFHPNNFCHLAGLRKMSDLREFQTENGRAVLSASNIFKKAFRGDFSDYYLQTSLEYTEEEKDRIECLANIEQLLQTKNAVYDFDKGIIRLRTNLKSSVILFSDESHNFYLMLGLAKDKEYYYPETFFLRFDDAYIHGQKIVHVEKLEIL